MNTEDTGIIASIPAGWPSKDQVTGWISKIKTAVNKDTGYHLNPRGPEQENCDKINGNWNLFDTGFDIVK